MERMIKFSIVVPIYNVDKFLPDCLNSLIYQTYDNIEIILVNDGSSDKSASICDQYAGIDDRIKVVHKRNEGLVSARKSGAEVATGDYICCIDGDDFVSRDYIHKFYEVLKRKAYDAVCCGYFLFTKTRKEKKVLPFKYGEYTRKQIESEVFPFLIESVSAQRFLPTVWGKAFKRELYVRFQEKVPEKIAMGEDGAVTIPIISEAESMFLLSDCLYYYRYNELSMTKVKKPLSWDGQKALVVHLYSAIQLERNDFQQQMYRRIAHDFFNVAKSQFNRHDSYWTIKKEILTYMDDSLFKDAIRYCHFAKSVKARMMEYALKKRWILLICLFNKASRWI